jgi:lipopolysaccharide biosynthesis glycosyltransferase
MSRQLHQRRQKNVNSFGVEMANKIIVSAANDIYYSFLLDLISSIEDAKKSEHVAIGILDVGLTAGQREALSARVQHIITPQWDYRFTSTPPRKFQAQTARPHLPRYFSNYEVIMWMDADTWIQQWSAVELFFEQAGATGLAVCQEMDRAYLNVYKLNNSRDLFYKHLWAFDPALAQRIGALPMINSGVFAMRHDYPIWSDWNHLLASVIQRGHFDFLTEQTALNICVYNRLPSRPCFMPARFNWACIHALPMFDEKSLLYVEPSVPYDEICIMHLTGVRTRYTTPFQIMDTCGKETLMDLSYSQWKLYRAARQGIPGTANH